MKIKRRQTREAILERYVNIASDYNAGLLVKDIAKRNNCSVETVYHALKKVVNWYKDEKEQTNE